jgi:Fibronectin type III domain
LPVAAHKRIVLLVVAIALAITGLIGFGSHQAKAGENDAEQVAPTGVTAVANAPGAVTVQWYYLGDVATLTTPFAFVVYNDTTGESQGINATSATILGLKPNQQYKFRVCASYSTGTACADDVPVTTLAAQPSDISTNTPPIITGNDTGLGSDGNPWIGLYWETAGTSVDYYEIYYEVRPASGLWQDPGTPVRAPNGASQSYHQVSDLQPGTPYLFKVEGCNRIIFGALGTQCSDLSPVFQASTPALGNATARPVPSLFGGNASSANIDIYWSVTPHYNYDHYVIQYYAQPASGTPGASVTAQVPGNQSTYQLENITPGTPYVFTVQGCDLILFPTPGVDCATTSAPYTVAPYVPLVTGGGTIIGNVPATINLSPPTVTSGNSLTVTGSAFPPNDGPVSLGYSWSTTNSNGGPSSGGGIGSPLTTVSSQGGFSATLTIPSDIPPTSVTVTAQSNSAKATATLQVVAPSAKGTLTLVYTPQGSGAVTDFAPDTPGYVLSGTNFTPGQVTIFLDSAQGPQLLTATVAANGTFNQTLEPSSAQIAGKYGQHTLVAIQNGAVQGQLSVTVDQPLHVG